VVALELDPDEAANTGAAIAPAAIAVAAAPIAYLRRMLGRFMVVVSLG